MLTDKNTKFRHTQAHLHTKMKTLKIFQNLSYKEGIKDSWKEYMEKLMKEENESDHTIEVRVKERPADCIRMAEVAAALKKMKRHKAPGMSGLVAEMTNPQGILELSGYWIYVMELWKIVVFQRTGSQAWYYQFTNGKGSNGVWIIQRN